VEIGGRPVLGHHTSWSSSPSSRITLLPRVLDAESRFERRPSDDEMTTMLDATRVTSLFGLPT